MMPGNIAAKQAMFDDLFGSRPQLASLIQTANSVPQHLAGVLAPVAGALMAKHCEWAGHWVPFGLMVATSALWAVGPETLAVENRKPFSMKRANAISSVVLLFKNGVGLRRLSVAAALFNSCNTAYVM